MFKYLKFIFVFLFELVKSNPIKLSLIVVSVILFSFAGTIPDSHDKYNIVAETKVENTYIYIYKTITMFDYNFIKLLLKYNYSLEYFFIIFDKFIYVFY